VPNLTTLRVAWEPRILSILRIVLGLLYTQHGLFKIFGFPPGPAPAKPYVLMSLVPGLAGLLELIGGILVAIGLFTRIVAFILSGEMAFAYFMAHAPRAFYPYSNGGELAILYCFAFLYLAFAGGGPWSLDAVRK
jgi:putative oxidoreductase